MRFLVNFLNLVILFFPTVLLSQNLPSRNFTTADGLSNDAVRSMFLDSKNTLWIGTENGVSMFESGNFKNLYKEDGLAQNSCWGICEDSNKNMWFASYGGGVSKFDGKNFKVFSTLNGLAHNKTRKVFSYKNKIIVGTEFGISIIDINSNLVTTPKEVFPHFGVFIVTDIFMYEDEIYFSALNEGFFKIINFTGNPTVIRVLEFQNSYSVGKFENKFYNSNKGFIDVIDFTARSARRVEKFGQSIAWQYAQDKRSNIYAACWGIFDNNGGLYQITGSKMVGLNDQFGITSQKLLNVVYDRRNDWLYVGSKDKGFFQIQLDHTIVKEDFGSKQVVRFQDNLILHENGVDLISGRTVQKKITRNDFKKFQVKSIGSEEIRKISMDKERFELNFDLQLEQIEFYDLIKHKNDYYVNSNIGIFVISSKTELLNYFPIHTYEFGFTADNLLFETHPYGPTRIYDSDKNFKVRHISNEVANIFSSIIIGETTYFLSVFNGLSSYKNGTFRSYLKEGLFREDKLKHSAKTRKGELLVSSEFGDVFLIRDLINFKDIQKISKEKIIGNSINFLESYEDYIIIGTEKGINIFKDEAIRLLDQEQGISDCTFKSSKIIDDFLYVSATKGFFKINLKKLFAEQEKVSKLEITKILVNNKSVPASKFEWFKYKGASLETPYNENTISIDFSALGTRFPDKLKFRYRLDDDNQWSPYSDKSNVFLPYLPFGNYNLEIEVLDMNSGTSTIFPLLKIKIFAPFYYQLWFILLVALSLGILIFFAIRRVKLKSRDKALIQKRIAETKLEALLSQMNPHFMFNAMNAIQNYVISNDTLNSLHYIGEFAKLMRKTLENSSKPTIEIREEIDYLKTYISIENMRFNNAVDVEFAVSENVNMMTQIPTMLLQPFVENVFVHAFSNSTENPKLIVKFELKNSTILQIQIIDNGKGMGANTNNLHQSKGTLLAKERLSLLHTNIQDFIEFQNNFPAGTIVVISLQV